MSATLDHLNAHREVLGDLPGRGPMLRPRPRIVCADGFSFSVQAGYGLYSSPRRDANSYWEVEVGFPSGRAEALMPYAKDAENPTGTVYAYVPVEVVDGVIAAHGGIA